MTIAQGTMLGPYEVLEPIGAGGMGEVYRARDTRLERVVAIKVLPEGLSGNEQFRARFEREAKTISSLNHPHICTLFDVGVDQSSQYLVMEMLEGESLAERLSRGPLPAEQVLRYGAQIAEALDRAHQSGIVHRDLKPGNVMLTKSGAKLLDFGLARPSSESSPLQGDTNLATAARPLTQEGTILGTFQYMAPEQLEGLETNARTDIFALGALLYEMATGRRAFEGRNRTSLIAAIISSQPPPISSFQEMAPPALDHIVRKCLEKDPDDRWQSARDVAGELRWISGSGMQAAPLVAATSSRRKWRERAAWGTAALLAVAFIGALARPKPAPVAIAGTMRLSMAMPQINVAQAGGYVAVAPDGSAIVFSGNDLEGRAGLFLRPLRDAAPRYLAGTSNAVFPFWSPDSRQIGFFADGKLKKVSSAGGDVEVVCDAPDARGGSWSEEGMILFSPSVATPLMIVDTRGGAPRPATSFDVKRKETTHRFPWFLPGGRDFVFIADSGEAGYSAFIGSVASTKVAFLMKVTRAPVYAEPGYLIHALDSMVIAQKFDPVTKKLGSDVVRLNEGIPAEINTGDRVASASRTGVLVVPMSIGGMRSKLAWLDRAGQTVASVPLPEGPFTDPRLSSDGGRVLMTMRDDIWMVDLTRGTPTRLTFGPGENSSGSLAPDGRRFAFHTNRSGGWQLYTKQIGGTGVETRLGGINAPWQRPVEWRGQHIMIDVVAEKSGYDIWYMSDQPDSKPLPYLATPANESGAQISPDGKWIAYASNESGRFQIYVQSFPIAGTKYQVSTNGGTSVAWTRGGRELLCFAADNSVVSVPVTLADELEFGAPQKVFTAPSSSGFDVTADGERFLAIVPVDAAASQSLNVVLNWAPTQ